MREPCLLVKDWTTVQRCTGRELALMSIDTDLKLIDRTEYGVAYTGDHLYPLAYTVWKGPKRYWTYLNDKERQVWLSMSHEVLVDYWKMRLAEYGYSIERNVCLGSNRVPMSFAVAYQETLVGGVVIGQTPGMFHQHQARLRYEGIEAEVLKLTDPASAKNIRVLGFLRRLETRLKLMGIVRIGKRIKPLQRRLRPVDVD